MGYYASEICSSYLSHGLLSDVKIKKNAFFISTQEMSSTTTSSTTDSSSESDEMDVQQGQDAEWITKKRKRSDDDDNGETKPAIDMTGEDGEPKRKKPRAPARRLEIPPFNGHILHIEGVDEKYVISMKKAFSGDSIQELFPGAQCEIVDKSLVKRLPTHEEKANFQLESKRLAKERALKEGRVKKELTEEQKLQRKLKNADPEYKEKKREMTRIKREVFNQNPENKQKYKKLVEAKLGKTVRKKPQKKTTEIVTEEVK